MSFRNCCIPMFSALFVSAVVIMHIALMRRAQAEQERPFGRYTTRQVVALTEPLGRLVAPECGRLSLRTERFMIPRPGGSSKPIWSVDGEDRAGNHVASFEWDADTGDLILVGHQVLDTGASARPLSRREAIEAAWRWLRDLGIAEKASQWRPLPAPMKGEAWTVHWQAEGQAATIQVDIYSGNLHSARCWRTNATPLKDTP